MAHDSIIDEAVSQLAGYFGEILVSKRTDKNAAVANLFEEFGDYLKANTAQAMHDKKRRVAERLMAELSEKEKETQMSRTEEMATMHKFIKTTAGGFTSIAKHIVTEGSTGLTEHEFTELWKSDAGSNSAFVKEFEGPRNERHDAYDIVHNASHVKAASFPNLMSVQVVSAETGSTLTSDDSYRAADELKALVATLRAKAGPTMTTEQLWDAVYRDPANRTITARAHPTRSSTDGSELQR
jgi:hypothetical protein